MLKTDRDAEDDEQGSDQAAEQKGSLPQQDESQNSAPKGKRKLTRKVEKSKTILEETKQRWNFGKLMQ